MKSISAKVMLLSTSFLFRFEAAYALSSNVPFPAFDRHGTHTHYTQVLAPVPHLSSAHPQGVASGEPQKRHVRVTSVCFITDTTDCRGGIYDIPDYNICVEEGYDKTTCPDEFYIPENYCPYDNKYFANCRDTCEGYVTCDDPYYGVGEACRGLYEKCECDTCPGYVFESDIPRGYHKVGEACNSCDGLKYKYEINSCDGFMECTNTGPEEGADVCWRGDTPTYSSCKPCANLGELDSCPEHYICKYEDCSKKYYKTGCEKGYIWDEAAKTCTPECDPNDRTCQCPGKHFCDPEYNKVGDGETCTTADGTTFYERCYVKETCFQTDYRDGDMWCKSRNRDDSGFGYFEYGTQCITQTNVKYRYFCSCNANSSLPNGIDAPCKGFKYCPQGGAIGAQTCECGKRTFYSECDTCNEDHFNGNGGLCRTTTESKSYFEDINYTGGKYWVKEKCTTAAGITINGVRGCNDLGTDCAGNQPPCTKMIQCENNEGADGEVVCECGGRKYFNKCKEECNIFPFAPIEHKLESNISFIIGGEYKVMEICTRLNGEKVYYRGICNDSSKDKAGNMPPCAGMKECPSGTFGTGDVCSCGGKLYYGSDCVTECTYEETAETCAAKGQSFEQKCYGTKNGLQSWYGECK